MSYKSGIINNLISNKLEITFPDGDCETITEANIVSESMKLRQAISDGDELRFGGCIASQFSVDLLRTEEGQFENLTGKWISVKLTQYYADPDELVYPSETLYPSNTLYPGISTGTREQWLFSGYIDSANASKTDKNVINVNAYDALAKLHETDATDFLYSFFKASSGTHSLDLLFTRILDETYNGVISLTISGTAAIRNETYNNGTTTVTVSSFTPSNEYWLGRKDRLSFGMLLRHICEIFAVFGVIVPDSGKGAFNFKTLNGTTETYGFYEALEAEDYRSTGFTDFSFSVSGNDRTGKSVIHGGLSDAADDSVDKIYDFSDNVLVMQPYTSSGQGRASTPFDYLINSSSIGTRLALNAESVNHTGQCTYSSYQPLEATLDGRPWASVGDPIEILVNETTVDGDWITDENEDIVKQSVKTYVLSRTLTGVQALTDNIIAKGAR